MLVVGLATSPTAAAVRRATVLIALLLPLDVVAFVLSGISDGGLGWDVALAIMHAAPGLGWLALGSVLLSHRSGGGGDLVVGAALGRSRDDSTTHHDASDRAR